MAPNKVQVLTRKYNKAKHLSLHNVSQGESQFTRLNMIGGSVVEEPYFPDPFLKRKNMQLSDIYIGH